MTARPRGSRHRVPRMWLLSLAGFTGLLVAAAVGVLSRSLVLDLVAWWPVWLALLLLAVALPGRRVGRVLLSGVVPLLALGALTLFTAAHVQGWDGLPSSQARLVGPLVGEVQTASIVAEVDGGIEIRPGSGFLYVVEPIRRGGDVPVPGASEELSGSHLSIVLETPPDAGLYGFSGWVLTLAAGPAWSIGLAGAIEADLSGLEIVELTVDGRGTVRFGDVSRTTTASVSGVFELILPHGVAVQVVGPAQVPPTWTATADGWESPTPGSGWVIQVGRGSSLRVSQG